MIKKRFLIISIVFIAVGFMHACKSSNQESSSEAEAYREDNTDASKREKEALPGEGEVLLFTEDEIGKVDPKDENNLAEINGELVDEDYVQKIEQDLAVLQNSISGGGIELPEGYPSKQVPIMQDAKLIEASSYSDHGYIIIYEIDKALEIVNDFYYDIVKQDPLSISEEDIYYENVKLKNSIVIAGLTIEYIDDDKTNVFITVFDEN